MADPLSIASSAVALVTFALQSSVTLYATIRSLQDQNKKSRALKNELNDLTGVLETLLDTIRNHPELDFESLKRPLHRCGKACEEYGEIIAKCTKYSSGQRPSLRDWFTQKYLQGDIEDFKGMLAVYKSTINIALANANIRIAAVTPSVVADYREMMEDTNTELKEHLRDLEEKFATLATKNASELDSSEIEWQALLEEKESTRQGLQICAQLSAQIEQLEATPKEHSNFSRRPSARKHVKSGLDVARGSIEALVVRLQSHEEEIDRQMAAMRSGKPLPDSLATQLEQLEETKESLSQCISVISNARDNLEVERRNISEDISMTGHSYELSVSNIGALFTARRVTLKDSARRITGQVNDESFQIAVRSLTQMDIHNGRSAPRISTNLSDTSATPEPATGTGLGTEAETKFHPRYGRGFTLAKQPEDTNVQKGVPQ